VDPAFEPDFIVTALRQSAELTQHLISPQGIPIMGRSICYRTAVAVPLLAANDPFWNAVEVADYRLELPRLGWTVEGRHELLIAPYTGDDRVPVDGHSGDSGEPRLTSDAEEGWGAVLAI
jgi:hypothetical protein